MNSKPTIQYLNRLVAIHGRSLAMYLSYAAPSWIVGDDLARETLHAIVEDQRAVVERIGELIVENGESVAEGTFPTVFTAYHDLSFDFLLVKLIQYQKRDIAAIEACVGELTMAPIAKAMAEEALGAAKGHLESLLDLKRDSGHMSPIAGSTQA